MSNSDTLPWLLWYPILSDSTVIIRHPFNIKAFKKNAAKNGYQLQPRTYYMCHSRTSLVMSSWFLPLCNTEITLLTLLSSATSSLHLCHGQILFCIVMAHILWGISTFNTFMFLYDEKLAASVFHLRSGLRMTPGLIK